MKEKPSTYSVTFLRLGRMVRLFLGSPSGRTAKLLAAALLTLMLLINVFNVANSYVGRDFMSSIERRDWAGFARFGWLYAGVFGLQTVVAVFFRFTEERLGLHWREWLTHHAVNRYTDKRIFLHLEEAGTISNPDQRISEDIKALTVSSLSFALMILNGTMTAISFSGVLWSISPALFAVAVLYAGFGSAVTIFFGRPLVRLNYRQSDCEADFRSELIRMRDNAEGIAMTGSESYMRGRLKARVRAFADNFRRIIAVNRNLSFFTTGYNYLIQLIPVLLVAPLFMRGEADFGVIGQSTMAFATLLGAFSLVVTQFQSISAYASVVARLGEFVDAIEDADDRSEASCIGCMTSSDHFGFSNLTLNSIHGEPRVLVRELTTSFVPGVSVCVTGANDAARHALFRACAAMYDAGTGAIIRPPPERIAFLPEQPYVPPGTLEQFLTPSDSMTTPAPEEIRAVLAELGLAGILEKHDGIAHERPWDDLLSLEDQQLLALARVLFSKPDFVLMDRMGTTLSLEAKYRVHRLLAARRITRIQFSRNKPDPALHDAALELHADGSWTWFPPPPRNSVCAPL
jgi:vitamin B12/bleomycin/antimicrobial peptide transport system ATP-binding/permease protein